jgi:hypothetical protein
MYNIKGRPLFALAVGGTRTNLNVIFFEREKPRYTNQTYLITVVLGRVIFLKRIWWQLWDKCVGITQLSSRWPMYLCSESDPLIQTFIIL